MSIPEEISEIKECLKVINGGLSSERFNDFYGFFGDSAKAHLTIIIQKFGLVDKVQEDLRNSIMEFISGRDYCLAFALNKMLYLVEKLYDQEKKSGLGMIG